MCNPIRRSSSRVPLPTPTPKVPLRSVIAFAALLAVAAPAGAAKVDPTRINAPAHDGLVTQQTLNANAAEEFQRVDAILQRVWEQASSRVHELDAPADSALTGWHTALQDAQDAWLAYREAHCVAEAFRFRGGSIEPMVLYACKTLLTHRRIAELLPSADGVDESSRKPIPGSK